MSKRKKGMSFEDKRSTMLNIFYEHKCVFNLKELEKLGGKSGVVVQTVKDVVQSLVDDSIVDFEKIGSQNFYWAFPSKATIKRKNQIDALTADLEKLEARKQELQAELATLMDGREGSDERLEMKERLGALQARHDELERELAVLRENDPEVLRELEGGVKTAKDATNRWTDNLWSVKSYVVKKLGRSSREVDQMLRLPADFDYVE